VSDSANHRVLLLNERGEFQQVIGEGVPSASSQGFNTPGGLAVDNDGNLYVADTLNRVVKKYSPMGIFMQTIGEGRLDLPSSVAVDEDGMVFVSDESAHLVSAFGPDGAYLGSIGKGQLEAPHSVKTDGELLYVMDRLAGLLVFQPDTASASVP
jgi:DNA-binding beta-propeller fold protein YncE